MQLLTSQDAARRAAHFITIRHDQPARGGGAARVFTDLTGTWAEVDEAACGLIVRLIDQGFTVEQKTESTTPDQRHITEWLLCR